MTLKMRVIVRIIHNVSRLKKMRTFEKKLIILDGYDVSVWLHKPGMGFEIRCNQSECRLFFQMTFQMWKA